MLSDVHSFLSARTPAQLLFAAAAVLYLLLFVRFHPHSIPSDADAHPDLTVVSPPGTESQSHSSSSSSSSFVSTETLLTVQSVSPVDWSKSGDRDLDDLLSDLPTADDRIDVQLFTQLRRAIKKGHVNRATRLAKEIHQAIEFADADEDREDEDPSGEADEDPEEADTAKPAEETSTNEYEEKNSRSSTTWKKLKNSNADQKKTSSSYSDLDTDHGHPHPEHGSDNDHHHDLIPGQPAIQQHASDVNPEDDMELDRDHEASSPSVPLPADTPLTFPDEQHVGSYIKRDNWHISGNHVMSHSLCTKLGDQCSVAKDEAKAMEICDQIPTCMGFTCNKHREDCQLRTDELKHDDYDLYVSYYKPAGLAKAIENAKRHQVQEIADRRPGSLAAPGFNFDGVCGQDGYKCVIVYGLYGDNPKYTDGCIKNALLVDEMFPGWQVRVYHDHTVTERVLQRLREANVELIRVEDIGGNIAGMFWRFLVASDPNVDRYLIRDSDSRLNPREAAAVAEWMKSGFSIHTIRDHPNHNRGLNGGMWGGVKGAVKDMTELVKNWNNRGLYAADLDFLAHKVWPLVKNDQLGHDSYSCGNWPNSVPFPTKRPDDYQHVGQVFEHDKPRYSDISCCLKDNPAPVKCRKHPDWTYG